MDLSDLQSLVGDLTNDPSHILYPLAKINTELDNTQDRWNVHAGILKDSVTLTTVDGTRQYAISGLTGTPIRFDRVAHKGIELRRRDKSWFDMFSGQDWSDDTGTPVNYFIEASDPDAQYVTVYPTPGSGDAGDNLVVEYVKRHTAMSASSDEPFNSNTLLRPYQWGLAYETAYRLLARDASAENAAKIPAYKKIADDVLAEVFQTFKAQEREEPRRLRVRGIWSHMRF